MHCRITFSSFAFGRAFGKRPARNCSRTKLIKDKNIFCSSSVFGQPDMYLIEVMPVRIYSSPPADAKLNVVGSVIEIYEISMS